MREIAKSRPVEYALTASLIALAAPSVVLFHVIGTVQRWTIVLAVIVAVSALGLMRRREFVRLRLSGSTILLVFVLGSVLVTGTTWFGRLLRSSDLDGVSFFVVLSLASVLAFLWSAVQLFRFRALQFVLEIPVAIFFAVSCLIEAAER